MSLIFFLLDNFTILLLTSEESTAHEKVKLKLHARQDESTIR
jgi:hypothetical protein